MADKTKGGVSDGGASGGGGGGPGFLASLPPSARPTITLPGRTSMEACFKGEISPGPMTLVSSFAEHDSFAQLLADAMASPNALTTTGRTGGRDGAGGEGGLRFKLGSPLGLALLSPQSPFVSIPPGLSPATLLDSPVFRHPAGQGPFGISHQQALAHVTAQAVQSQAHMHLQSDYTSGQQPMSMLPFSQAAVPGAGPAPVQEVPSGNADEKTNTSETTEYAHSNQRTQQHPVAVDKPSSDGYHWRKYGQKQVKGSEFPRSYYKCTSPNCPAKKKVEHSLEGQVTEIIYKGQHNHQPPQPSKRAKGGGSTDVNGNFNLVKTEMGTQDYVANASREEMKVKKNQDGEQSSASSEDEEGGDDTRTDDGDDGEPDPKRRCIDTGVTQAAAPHRTIMEPRIIVQTTSEVDLLDDGYKWRKYGQKVVKGNPHPRSYYKCTNAGCSVRKHVERASTDPKAVITTYEGKHNHDVPAPRTSSHHTVNPGSSSNNTLPKPVNPPVSDKPATLKMLSWGNNEQQHVTTLQSGSFVLPKHEVDAGQSNNASQK
ncbi:probable WRKY transcription factor 4 [Nymphaea colorata]|nr:probable WRKY transcription factor 4 [Nymphaea colorata]